ncbi:MAG: hypothetical protein IJD32_04470 [Bacteroidaceae bacterium]|nr:hypothetical protein [Bacteroidaceae bacterium]MBQ4056341.1 hypothetical protein [Bacteroidaceae bacterium]MBR6622129.1 hypothetical protein [Bacteroides sp.]
MDIQYLIRFEEKMQDDLLRLATTRGMLKGVLLATEDIDEQWKILAPEYMGDAVPQIAHYPTVSVAWAAYLGMAVAYGWDADWETFLKMPYQSYYGEQGFDDMDEHIVRDLLRIPLDSRTAKELEETIRQCGEKAVDLIRYEQIPPQSEMAFHVFARACKAMYKIGAAIQLKRMGYNFEKVNLGN